MSVDNIYKAKIEDSIEEDEIIKSVMLEHADLYSMLEFNEYNIKGKLEINAYWYQQFRLLSISERRKLSRIQGIHDKYIGELYHKLKHENDISLTKTEIEKFYIPKDDMAIWYKTLLQKQEIRVETFDAIKDAFKQQGYNMTQFIKNMIDL